MRSFFALGLLVALGCAVPSNGAQQRAFRRSAISSFQQETDIFTRAKEDANIALVEYAINALYNEADEGVLDELFSEFFVQHNPFLEDGVDGLRDAFITDRPEGLTYEFGGSLAEGDFVCVFARVTGIAETPQVVADFYKVVNGKIAEHWDIATAFVPAEETVSGNVMWPIEQDIVRTGSDVVEEANRRLVIEATVRWFGLNETSTIDNYWDRYGYIQHNPGAPNGVEVLIAFFGAGEFTYETSLAIAYGDYVVLWNRFMCECYPGGQTLTADWFRVENGTIVEHWDVLQPEVFQRDTVSGNRHFPVAA